MTGKITDIDESVRLEWSDNARSITLCHVTLLDADSLDEIIVQKRSLPFKSDLL